MCCFCFKQKTAYDMRISGWSSDVCSSDLNIGRHRPAAQGFGPASAEHGPHPLGGAIRAVTAAGGQCARPSGDGGGTAARSEEHTSELQSLMRISYAVFCLKKKTTNTQTTHNKIYHVYK